MASRFRIPLLLRLRRRLGLLVPLLVWGLAATAAVQLYLRRTRTLDLTGLAVEIAYEVAPSIPGRLGRLEVRLGDVVAADQIVGAMDDQELRLSLGEARTELDRLAAELEREEKLWQARADEQRGDLVVQLRRFARDEEDARIRLLRARAELSEDKIRLQHLESVLGRSSGLSESELSPRAQLELDQAARDALKKRISENAGVVVAREQKLEQAKARYDEFRRAWFANQPEPDLLVKPWQYAVKVQELRIEQVNLAITRLMLRSPSSGRVAEILRRPGETVGVGEAVVRVVEPRSREVVAYVPEERLLEYREGQRVMLRRLADPNQLRASKVSSRGSKLVQLPLRLSAGLPRWGIPIYVELPEDWKTVPGEVVEVLTSSED